MTQFRYHIITVNITLSLVGGTAGAIMFLLHMLVGWYPNFTYRRSLMRKLYTEATAFDDKQDNPTDIKSRLANYKPFVYNLQELFLMNLINFFTCGQMCRCCKSRSIEARKERYDKYQKAKKRMSEEFDFLEIIKRIRVLSMLTSLLFAQRQSIFVSYADQFHISLEEEIPKEAT